MRFPVEDWQFWVVTLAAILAAGWLLRSVLPIPWLRRRRLRRRTTSRATLTVGGKTISR